MIIRVTGNRRSLFFLGDCILLCNKLKLRNFYKTQAYYS